jgi:hypothetical protein
MLRVAEPAGYFLRNASISFFRRGLFLRIIHPVEPPVRRAAAGCSWIFV